MLKNIYKYSGQIITFIATILLTLILFKEIGILDGTILISDLNAEYGPLLKQIDRIVTNDIGLFHYNTGMGDSFIGTFYYYVSCPLNILSVFIKDTNLLVIILVLLKLGLAGLFSYQFFKYQFKKEKKTYLTLFSLVYALSSFSLSYYLHIMWLDVYLLFPLVLLGIDKIIKERKHLLYIVSLILIIFCNYYFAYMVCIFSFIYFNYKLLINKNNIKYYIKENIHFIIVSILACIGASIVLIPIASELSTYSRQNSELFAGEQFKIIFNLKTFIKEILLGNVSNVRLLNDNSFYLHSSIIVLPLIYFYYINKNITNREKKLTTIILTILLLSISINYINFMWHGFVAPSFFNGRYTFMFILFILLIALKAMYDINEYKWYHFIIISIILFIPIITLIKLDIYDVIKLIFLFLFIILLRMVPSNNYVRYTLLLIVCLELIINGNIYLSRYNFKKYTNPKYENAVNYIKKVEKDKFYRIEDDVTSSDNYSILYNYNSIDYFMSTVKIDLIDFFINLGVGNHNYTKNTISYDGKFYLLSSLLNIKYYIEDNEYNDNIYTLKYTNKNSKNVYYNPYSLNIGYMVNKNIIKTKLNKNGLENINNIYKDMSNIKVLEKTKVKKEDNYNYSFTNNSSNNFYILVEFKNWYSYSDFKIKLNDTELNNDNGTFNYHVINKYDIDEEISLTIEGNDGTIEDIKGIYIYYYDMDKFKDSIEKLKQNELKITNIKGNTITGKINIDNNNILFTSIPYNKDLHIYVDGKEVKKIKLLDTFIGCEIDKGKHTIEIKYIPKILYLSFIPSILSLLILYIYIKKTKKTES